MHCCVLLSAALLFMHGAPNSPLAQPRNALGGCTLAATISILFYYLSGPDFANALPKWAAQALAPATERPSAGLNALALATQMEL